MARETKSGPHPIDVHVGARVKLRRTMLGMSQETLGTGLGVTFQQLQKYEKGANRIAASRLAEIARLLGVEVSFFFEDAPTSAAAPGRDATEERIEGVHFHSPITLQLNTAFASITNHKVRMRVLRAVEAIAGTDEAMPAASKIAA